jgi:hypothetical protein
MRRTKTIWLGALLLFFLQTNSAVLAQECSIQALSGELKTAFTYIHAIMEAYEVQRRSGSLNEQDAFRLNTITQLRGELKSLQQEIESPSSGGNCTVKNIAFLDFVVKLFEVEASRLEQKVANGLASQKDIRKLESLRKNLGKQQTALILLRAFAGAGSADTSSSPSSSPGATSGDFELPAAGASGR